MCLDSQQYFVSFSYFMNFTPLKNCNNYILVIKMTEKYFKFTIETSERNSNNLKSKNIKHAIKTKNSAVFCQF